MWELLGAGWEIGEATSRKRQSQYTTYREALGADDELHGKLDQNEYVLVREY